MIGEVAVLLDALELRQLLKAVLLDAPDLPVA
eukprot:CAMPEP_0170505814 /NCGR_PEP_ID=MMETSP0208-20121228/52337_1 /TAXON_ID=197538 /ORGANISM="Strombidium inclinatum, Strain S3" /LENGTH=31 /DNA_ID= /DNA_START= /DNA_END= /DNA_ORIENTATION=